MSLFLNNKYYVLIVIFTIFLIGYYFGKLKYENSVIIPKVLREDGFKYIKPVLLCNTDNQQQYNEDLSLTKKINDYLKESKNSISVYFLNLSNGQWASINENLTFSPASMLKVPTVVDAFKFSELNSEILNKKIYYDGSFDNNKAEYFKSNKKILPNKFYTISELMSYSVENSDNNAIKLLHENISAKSLDEIYKDLKIDIPRNISDYMSAKTYSLFLRVLFNSTYLERINSENVLSMMIKSDFPIGLKAGVPKDIDVASKFGERQIFSTSGEIIRRELHDCGIVYGMKQNYILCVMTSGKDFNNLAKNISDISSIVYKHANE